jgi:hypothetical protein
MIAACSLATVFHFTSSACNLSVLNRFDVDVEVSPSVVGKLRVPAKRRERVILMAGPFVKCDYMR